VLPARASRPQGEDVVVTLQTRPRAVSAQRFAPAAEHLQAATGARWDLTWDPWNRVARSGVGGRGGTGARRTSAELLESARRFRDTHAALFGAETTELRRVRWLGSGHAWHATWQQTLAGRPLLRCIVDLTLTPDGNVIAFRSFLVPEATGTWPGADPARALEACSARLEQPLAVESTSEVWVVEPLAGRYRLVPALQLRLQGAHGARWRGVVESRSGRILELESLLRHARLGGETRGDVKPLYAHDEAEIQTFPHVEVQFLHDAGLVIGFSNALGIYTLDGPQGGGTLSSSLHGRFVSVANDSPDGASPGFSREIEIPGEIVVHFGSLEARDDERMIYYHTNVIHHFVREQLDFTLLDYPVPAVAAVRNPINGNRDYANAFWDGNRMAFGNGAPAFQNFGLFADVIYHEYTHAITDHMYRPAGGLVGLAGGAIHEGLSDYFACTITDEPLIGEFLTGGPDYLRNLDNQLLWPDDRHPSDEVHANGEILGGALWDVRRAVGAEVADRIIHHARTLFPQDFEEYLDAILIQDDLIYGDGAPGNGSPHRDAILFAFAQHGMGPLGGREIRIRHEPLLDSEEVGVARTVHASIGSLLPGVIDEMLLHWRLVGGDENQQRMQPDAQGGFIGEIPGHAEGTDVEYYLRAIRSRPFEEYRLPEDGALFRYHVGPDLIPPTIAHALPSVVPAFSWPATLSMRLDDNLGLAYAYVEYVQNGKRGPTLGLVRSAEDRTLYATQFPVVGGEVGDVIEYAIIAVDASRTAHETRFPAQGMIRFELVRDLEEGFENGPGTWIHRPVVAAQPDPWKITTAFNHSPGGQRAWLCGSEDESEEYPERTAAELVSDWYRIGNGALASVWSWMDAEQNGPDFAFDGGVVEIQVEGNLAWEPLVPAGGYTHTMSETAGTNVLPPGRACLSGRGSGWDLLTFDLGPWGGQRVRLRFLFGSDNVATFFNLRGWLLDDLRVEPGVRDPSDAPAPAARTQLLVGEPTPNPFNPRVTFTLDVPAGAGRVQLQIHDARGRLVMRLLDGELAAGRRQVVWDGADEQGRAVASGIYLYRLESLLGAERGKLALLR
jgi:hypothetical protein